MHLNLRRISSSDWHCRKNGSDPGYIVDSPFADAMVRGQTQLSCKARRILGGVYLSRGLSTVSTETFSTSFLLEDTDETFSLRVDPIDWFQHLRPFGDG